MADNYVCFVTAPVEQAPELARQLVEARLAACVNRVTLVTSTYWWEGEVQEDQEALLIIKTSSAVLPSLINKVREAHPYDVPEVIAMPIDHGNPDYLQWIHQSVD